MVPDLRPVILRLASMRKDLNYGQSPQICSPQMRWDVVEIRIMSSKFHEVNSRKRDDLQCFSLVLICCGGHEPPTNVRKRTKTKANLISICSGLNVAKTSSIWLTHCCYNSHCFLGLLVASDLKMASAKIWRVLGLERRRSFIQRKHQYLYKTLSKKRPNLAKTRLRCKQVQKSSLPTRCVSQQQLQR